MQYNGHEDESSFKKPRGHEQFIASLHSAKLATTQTISNNLTDQVLDPDPRYTHHQMFLKNSVYEEPIKSIDAKP